MAETLEPCPDCDSRELTMEKVPTRSAYRVVCTLCGSRGLYRKTEAGARRIWNALWNTRKQKEPTK